MANTYLCLFYHIIFSTKNREPWLTDDIRKRTHTYLAATINELSCRALIINGTADHIHILCQLNSTDSVAKVTQELKANSSGWFKKTFRKSSFSWQTGYGAFTVSASQKEKVYQYIATQDEHHRCRSFKEEYLEFLSKHKIGYDEKYLLD